MIPEEASEFQVAVSAFRLACRVPDASNTRSRKQALNRLVEAHSVDFLAVEMQVENAAEAQLFAQIFSHYPYPLAKAWQVYNATSKDQTVERYRCLLGITELLLQYLALIAVQCYFLQGQPHQKLGRLLHNAFNTTKSWTAGTIWAVLENAVQVLHERAGGEATQTSSHSLQRSLFTYLLTPKGKRSVSAINLNAHLPERNAFAHFKDGINDSPEKWQQLERDLKRAMLDEMERCDWMQVLKVYQPLAVSDTGLISGARVYRGIHISEEVVNVQLSPDDAKRFQSVSSELLLMVNQDRPEEYFSLFPLSLTPPGVQQVDHFLLTEWQRRKTSVTSRKTLSPIWRKYYAPGEHQLDEHQPANQHLTELFLTLHQHASTEIDSNDAAYLRWEAVRDECDEHLANFVGRESVLAGLREWIENPNEKGTYLSLTGRSGLGKSAVMAQLQRQLTDAKIPCLLLMGRGLSEPGAALRAALFQTYELLKLHDIEETLEWNRNYAADGLLSQLRHHLCLLAESSPNKRVIWIVDAINEMQLQPDDFADPQQEKFFPRVLGPGICVIFTSHPGSLIAQAVEGFAKRHYPLETQELSAFIAEEMEDYLEKRLETHWQKVLGRYGMTPKALFDISRGHALSLRAATDLMQRHSDPKGSTEQARKSLEAALRQPAQSILAPYGTNDFWKQLLNVLALSREPISHRILESTFGFHTNEEKQKLETALSRLKPILVVRGLIRDAPFRTESRLYQLFHEMLNETLQEQMSPWEKSASHQCLVEALAGEVVGEEDIRYQLRNLPHHTLAVAQSSRLPQTTATKDVFGRLRTPSTQSLENWRNLAYLLTNFEFLRQKVELGLVYDLLHDFQETLMAWPSNLVEEQHTLDLWHRFLNSEAYRLAQWPQLFFQQSLNQADDHPASIAAELWQNENQPQYSYFRWENKPKNHTHSALIGIIGKATSIIQSLALSNDGNTLFSSDGSGEVRAWDIKNGTYIVLGQIFEIHDCQVISGDGRTLYTSNKQGEVCAWNVESGEHDVLVCTGQEIVMIKLNKKCDTLFFVSKNGDIFEYSILSNIYKSRSAKDILNVSRSALVSEDGEFILYENGKYDIYMYNFSDNSRKFLFKDKSWIKCMHTDTRNGLIFYGCQGGELKCYQIDGSKYRSLGSTGWRSKSLTLSDDRLTLYSGDWSGEIRSWNVRRETHIESLEPISKVNFDHTPRNGSRDLASIDENGTFLFTDLEDFQDEFSNNLKKIDFELSDTIVLFNGIRRTLSNDGRTLCFLDDDGRIRFWDFEDKTFTTFNFDIPVDLCMSLIYGEHDNLIYSSHESGAICKIDIEKNISINLGKVKTSPALYHVEVSRDGSTIFSSHANKEIFSYDIKSGICTSRTFMEKTTTALLGIDSGTLFVSLLNGNIIFWDITRRQKHLIGKSSNVICMTLSNDGRILVSINRDGEMFAWNIEHGGAVSMMIVANCRVVQWIENDVLACVDKDLNICRFSFYQPKDDAKLEVPK